MGETIERERARCRQKRWTDRRRDETEETDRPVQRQAGKETDWPVRRQSKRVADMPNGQQGHRLKDSQRERTTAAKKTTERDFRGQLVKKRE